MPRAYKCRLCKGPPLPQPPEGPCPTCHRFARYEPCRVLDGEVDGAAIPPMKDGEPISAADLLAGEDDEADTKRATGSPGVDWVFDGGLPAIATILLCAKEGMGKTTWLWGLLHLLAEKHKRESLYISSEQSLRALRSQFKRLGLKPSKRMVIHSEADKDAIIRSIEKAEPKIVVVDSLHEVENITDESGYEMATGTGPAVTRVAKEIRRLAEEMSFLVFLIGHMNNDGMMAGSAHLRHAVDATLKIDCVTTKEDPRRILRFEKSRFAPLERRALFRMGDKGMKDCGPIRREEDLGEAEDEPTPTARMSKKRVLN